MPGVWIHWWKSAKRVKLKWLFLHILIRRKYFKTILMPALFPKLITAHGSASYDQRLKLKYSLWDIYTLFLWILHLQFRNIVLFSRIIMQLEVMFLYILPFYFFCPAPVISFFLSLYCTNSYFVADETLY